MKKLITIIAGLMLASQLCAEQYILYRKPDGRIVYIGSTIATSNDYVKVGNASWCNLAWYSWFAVDSTTSAIPAGVQIITNIANRVNLYPPAFNTNAFRAETKLFLTNTLASTLISNSVITNASQVVISSNTPSIVYGYLKDLNLTNRPAGQAMTSQFMWYNGNILSHGGWGAW